MAETWKSVRATDGVRLQARTVDGVGSPGLLLHHGLASSQRIVADIWSVSRATGLHRPVVVGHSWGAMAALKLAARKPRGLSAAVLIDGGLVAPRSAFPDWATAKRALAPPPLGGMPLEEFLDDAGRYLPVELTPEVERLVLSLMRVDRQGRIWPRLSVQHPKGLSKRIDGFVRAAVG